MYGSLMCIHRYELGQTRHRREKCVTELVPFKHVGVYSEESLSHGDVLTIQLTHNY